MSLNEVGNVTMAHFGNRNCLQADFDSQVSSEVCSIVRKNNGSYEEGYLRGP